MPVLSARIARLRSILDNDDPSDYHAQLHHMVAFRYESIVPVRESLGQCSVYDFDPEPLYAGGRDRGRCRFSWLGRATGIGRNGSGLPRARR